MSTHTSSTPTFPLPASAGVHPRTTTTSTASPSATTTGPAKATVPPTASTLTTTYVPSGGTPLPSTTSAGSAATVPTTATPFKPALSTHTRPTHNSTTLSTGAIVIAVAAAVLLLACLGWALARRRAFEPHWLLSLRHAMAEAGFRASATWAEFSDWVRLGH
jgi:hypothetical protein